ncbi:hypothetical protein PHMEG_00020473, partial [Phytophthora megakarya]
MKCVSSECGLGGGLYPRRYKILVCEQSDSAIIYMKYEHLIPGGASSPKKPRLTTQMNTCLDGKLSENAALKPEDLSHYWYQRYNVVKRKGQNQQSRKYKATLSVGDWSTNKILCNPYDTLENIEETGDNLIVFCDSKLVDNRLIPDIGNGDESSPFRIGLTSFSLLNSYASLQDNDRISTIIHVDSTHNIRAYLEKFFSISFVPRFVMSDADDAQFNACQQQLAQTKLLISKYYETLQRISGYYETMFFRDLNNLHFCTTEQEYVDKRNRILSAWKSAAEFYQPFRSVYERLKTEWMVDGRGRPSRFSCWQIYHSPTGCASTNNPVETYHKTLKLVNKSSNASLTKLVDRLDKSRIGFLGSNKNVKFVHEVSKRLRALYNRQVKYGELGAVPLER